MAEGNMILSKLKIAIVDDHDLVRTGLSQVLADAGLTDVDNYSTGSGLIDGIDEGKHYDLFILDLELPDMDGCDLIEKLRYKDEKSRIIVSTVHDEIWTLRMLLACNVNAIIYKSAGSKDIITAIKEVSRGYKYYCDEVKEAIEIAEDKSLHPSMRELEVLVHIAQGKTTREIAAIMFVSENTVEAHRKALLSKLGAVNMADLIMKAVAKGYVKKNDGKP